MSLRLALRRLRNRMWPPRFRRFAWIGGKRVELGKEEK